FANLAGGKVFCKIDLRDAYSQICLDEESKSLTVINTPKGLYEYNRVPYGISSGPALFQREMDQLLKRISGVAARLDDILISGKDQSELLERLESVLKILEESGLRLKKEKCEFMTESLCFLGHLLTKDGLQPMPEKVKAIVES